MTARVGRKSQTRVVVESAVEGSHRHQGLAGCFDLRSALGRQEGCHLRFARHSNLHCYDLDPELGCGLGLDLDQGPPRLCHPFFF